MRRWTTRRSIATEKPIAGGLRMTRILPLLSLAAVLLATPLAAEPLELVVDGRARTYVLERPPGQGPRPTIILLHGLGGTGAGYAQRSGDRTGAELDFRLREGSRERRQARVAVSGTSASVVGEGPLGRSKRGSWPSSLHTPSAWRLPCTV